MLHFDSCVQQLQAGPRLMVQCIALQHGCRDGSVQGDLLFIESLCLAGNNFLNGNDSPIGQVSCSGDWHCKATGRRLHPSSKRGCI